MNDMTKIIELLSADLSKSLTVYFDGFGNAVAAIREFGAEKNVIQASALLNINDDDSDSKIMIEANRATQAAIARLNAAIKL